MSRTYDAAQSRAQLLQAAQELFSELGYERTTTRRLAEHAGVDAALIARYFGNKEGLYLAAVAAEGWPAETDHYDSARSIALRLFERTRLNGPGPIMQALVRSDTTPEVRAAATHRLHELFVDPLEAALREQGIAHARLRAEITLYSLVGVVIGRAQAGSELAQTDQDTLVDLMAETLNGLMAVVQA